MIALSRTSIAAYAGKLEPVRGNRLLAVCRRYRAQCGRGLLLLLSARALWFVCRPSRLLPRQRGMHGSATNSRHAEETARKMFTGNAVFHAMTCKQFIVCWRLVSRHAGRKISRVSASVFRCIGSFCHNKRQAYASGNCAYMRQGFSVYA